MSDAVTRYHVVVLTDGAKDRTLSFGDKASLVAYLEQSLSNLLAPARFIVIEGGEFCQLVQAGKDYYLRLPAGDYTKVTSDVPPEQGRPVGWIDGTGPSDEDQDLDPEYVAVTRAAQGDDRT